jgi:hypothetical protein
MNSSRLRFLALALCLLLLPPALLAQAGVASLSGLVSDPSGAIIAGAQVTETNLDTQASHNTITDRSGYFTFVGLPVGHYRVAVNQAGFRAQETTLLLDPSEQARQDFHLAMAGAIAQVEVSEAQGELARVDSSVGTVIDNETIVGTPLFQRNWDDLIRLVPGVQMQRFTQQSGSSVSGSTGLFVIHGVGNEQNDYILDGVDNNTFSENLQELSASASRPSVDVIGEFKLISSPYTAIYGRSPGAQVDVITKGGTNQFHGLLFEYLRNRIFDSNDYFTHGAGLPKPKEIQNQFGGNFGGPVLRSRLFGFFDYEGTRIRQGVTRISTVPLPNERIGDYSAVTAAAVAREITGFNPDRIDSGLGPMKLPNFKGYFVIQFSKPFADSGTYPSQPQHDFATGAFAKFHTTEGEVVEARIGTSFISLDQARKNLQAEIRAELYRRPAVAAQAMERQAR